MRWLAFPLLVAVIGADARAQTASRPTRASLDRMVSVARVGLAKCSRGAAGSLDVDLSFAPDGHVDSARIVGGTLAASPRASCFDRALRSLHVPAFQSGTFSTRFRVTLP